VGDAKLVHRVQRAPCLTLHIEQVHLSVSVRVLAANQNDFCWADSQSGARPKWILHADSEDDPWVLINVVHLNRIVDLLLGATEETAKSVDELVVDRAGAEIMPLVLHDSHLRPLVRLNLVLLDGVQALLAAEASKNVDVATAHGDGVRIPTLVHGALVGDLVLQGQVQACIFLRWGAAASDQDLCWRQSDRGRALVELAGATVAQLLDRPLILVHVVAQADL